MPINRLIDVRKHMDLIANSIVYTPARARQLVAQYLDERRRLRLRARTAAAASRRDSGSLDEFWSRRWPRSSTARTSSASR